MPTRLLLLLIALLAATGAESRPLSPEDYFRFRDVDDIQVSPDGNWVAYVVTSADREADDLRGAVWLTSWTGTESLQLTHGESASAPRFSPDGRYVSFLSARSADGKAQVWLLDRHGGEARQLSHVGGDITRYEWSPDSQRLVLSMREGDEQESESGKSAKTPKPLVINAFHFKLDGEGYLTAASRSRLYLLDVKSGVLEALTTVPAYDDRLPTWSRDGKQIAFVSNHLPEADRTWTDEIYLVEAKVGATPRRLVATHTPNYQRLTWSPDGQWIAFKKGEEARYSLSSSDNLAVVNEGSGEVRNLTDRLDRGIHRADFTANDSIVFTVEDDGFEYPARVTLSSGKIERLIAGPVTAWGTASAAGHTAVLASTDSPTEVYALEDGRLRRLTSQNDALFREIELGAVEDVRFKSRDGTEIHGQIVKPPSFVKGRRYPTVLWMHGGPNLPDDHSLPLSNYSPTLDRQLLASRGYLVLAVNYRGGTGRGATFAHGIVADWGHKDLEDVLAAVDYAVAQGIADPTRLALGGWSYGGILTDYAIASDGRFKAAISGGGSANQVAIWGTDEYSVSSTAEIGTPWRNADRWLRISYPFFHADRIHTPTLFLGGEKDCNVPIGGSEQMYQALRTLGVPTQLVVYPGQYHDPTRPSYLQDRAERYLAWFAKYLGDNP